MTSGTAAVLDMNRPQHTYRQRLLEEVVSLRPARILEVGCGGGGFLGEPALSLG